MAYHPCDILGDADQIHLLRVSLRIIVMGECLSRPCSRLRASEIIRFIRAWFASESAFIGVVLPGGLADLDRLLLGVLLPDPGASVVRDSRLGVVGTLCVNDASY